MGEINGDLLRKKQSEVNGRKLAAVREWTWVVVWKGGGGEGRAGQGDAVRSTLGVHLRLEQPAAGTKASRGP